MNKEPYSKNFDAWHPKKKELNAKNDETPHYHEREVWWCALGVNIGDEADGTGDNFDRPVLVIKGFSRYVFIGVSLTGRRREGKFYFPLGKIDPDDTEAESSAVLSQVRLIDARRLIRRMTILDEGVFTQVKEALQILLFGNTPEK